MTTCGGAAGKTPPAAFSSPVCTCGVCGGLQPSSREDLCCQTALSSGITVLQDPLTSSQSRTCPLGSLYSRTCPVTVLSLQDIPSHRQYMSCHRQPQLCPPPLSVGNCLLFLQSPLYCTAILYSTVSTAHAHSSLSQHSAGQLLGAGLGWAVYSTALYCFTLFNRSAEPV